MRSEFNFSRASLPTMNLVPGKALFSRRFIIVFSRFSTCVPVAGGVMKIKCSAKLLTSATTVDDDDNDKQAC